MKKILLFLGIIFLFSVLSGCITAVDHVDSSRDERCFLEPDPGPCEAAISRFYLGEDRQCKEFLWGGCDGVAPFQTLEECRTACGIEVVPDVLVPIESSFEDKIVYTTDAAVNTVPLKADCDQRGGSFNECGSPCPSDALGCIDVCAFTCELLETGPDSETDSELETVPGLDASVCKALLAEECPDGCTVCPPCEECSAITCQSNEFCKSIGFGKDWFESVQP